MNRRFALWLTAAGLLVIGFTLSTCHGAETKKLHPEPPLTAPNSATRTTIDRDSVAPTARLGRLKLRGYGATFREVTRIYRELDAAGELDHDCPDLISLQILERLQAERPQEFAQLRAGADWAAILDIIMQVIDKIIELLERFDWLSAVHDTGTMLQLTA